MNGGIVASAPGKLVLSGEYAVLDGAPAISMAVDRRARVIVEPADGDVSAVRAPGFAEVVGRFQWRDGGLHWLTAVAPYEILDAAVSSEPTALRETVTITLDTQAFVDPATQLKLGVGSSAAIAVALCRALSPSDDPGRIFAAARRAHTQVQGGVGSGVDIACSVYGGLIEYQTEGSTVAALSWPSGLRYRTVWSGVSASTRDKLSQLGAATRRPSRVRLAAAAESMAAAWRRSGADDILAAYREYIAVLREFGDDHGLDIFAAGHDHVCRIADEAGIVYKPCGAGAGDVGILLCDDDDKIERMRAAMPAGFAWLDCQLSESGVTLQRAGVAAA